VCASRPAIGYSLGYLGEEECSRRQTGSAEQNGGNCAATGVFLSMFTLHAPLPCALGVAEGATDLEVEDASERVAPVSPLRRKLTRNWDEGEVVPEERRGARRFPFQSPVRYRSRDRDSRFGTTINLSGSGVLFTSDDPLRDGQRVQVTVDWPVMRPGGIPLVLDILGQVVRREADRVAVKVRKYEIRPFNTPHFYLSF
jgi:hypothetical protein